MSGSNLFLLNLIATWYMVGLIWMVQVVHYNLFDRVGNDQFAQYESDHGRLITPIVGVPMLLEITTSAALLLAAFWLVEIFTTAGESFSARSATGAGPCALAVCMPMTQIASTIKARYVMRLIACMAHLLFLLIATPVAASAHIMVVAARGDSVLAANIVVLTTALSLLTITVGFFLLSAFSLVGELR